MAGSQGRLDPHREFTDSDSAELKLPALQFSPMSRTKSLAPSPDPPKFRNLLVRWYRRHQRKLPWRGQTDPYRILVSEIMLQQTRVAVVEKRYKMFLRQFPNARRLARARQQAVLAAWSGLGYYRRARSLHAAAKLVIRPGGVPPGSGEPQAFSGRGRDTRKRGRGN